MFPHKFKGNNYFTAHENISDLQSVYEQVQSSPRRYKPLISNNVGQIGEPPVDVFVFSQILDRSISTINGIMLIIRNT